MAFEKYILPENENDSKISLHAFKAVFSEYIFGRCTGPQCLAAIEMLAEESLDSSSVSDLQSITALIDNETGNVNKLMKLDELYRVFILAESGIWYTTRALLKSRLGFS